MNLSEVPGDRWLRLLNLEALRPRQSGDFVCYSGRCPTTLFGSLRRTRGRTARGQTDNLLRPVCRKRAESAPTDSRLGKGRSLRQSCHSFEAEMGLPPRAGVPNPIDRGPLQDRLTFLKRDRTGGNDEHQPEKDMIAHLSATQPAAGECRASAIRASIPQGAFSPPSNQACRSLR
jgi:hypothetical protein